MAVAIEHKPMQVLLTEILANDYQDNVVKWTSALAKEGVVNEKQLVELSDKDFDMTKIPAVLRSALRHHRDKHFRKPFKCARTCYVSVRILTLSDVDMNKNSFRVEMVMFLLWEDPTLDGLGQNMTPNWKQVWQPIVTIMHCDVVQDDYFTRDQAEPKLIRMPHWDRHKVLYVRKVSPTIHQHFDLVKFPFDVQLLQIHFRPTEHNQLVMLKAMNEKDFHNSMSPMVGVYCPEWIVHYPQHEEATDDYSLNRPYSVYSVLISLERHPGFYMYNLVFINFVLGSIGLGIAPTTPATLSYARSDMLLTLILTLIALKLVTNDWLPNISYMTWLDKYTVFTLLFQVLQLVCNYYIGIKYLGFSDGGLGVEVIDDDVAGDESSEGGAVADVIARFLKSSGKNSTETLTEEFREEVHTLQDIDTIMANALIGAWVVVHTYFLIVVVRRMLGTGRRMRALDGEWTGQRRFDSDKVRHMVRKRVSLGTNWHAEPVKRKSLMDVELGPRAPRPSLQPKSSAVDVLAPPIPTPTKAHGISG
jgi:hypothetical protein